jgi:polysaccharide biosynthesis protein PslG
LNEFDYCGCVRRIRRHPAGRIAVGLVGVAVFAVSLTAAAAQALASGRGADSGHNRVLRVVSGRPAFLVSSNRTPPPPTEYEGIETTPVWWSVSRARLQAEFRVVKAAGANMTRLGFPWPILEPTGPSFAPRMLAKVGWVLQAAHKAGLKVLAQLQNTACWDSTDPATPSGCGPGSANSLSAIYPPANLGDYDQFAYRLIRKFGSYITAVELENEPDNSYFYQGTAETLTALYRSAYPAIKRADRHVIVLLGPLGGADTSYLQQLYADGIQGSFNAVSIHPYDINSTGSPVGFADPLIPDPTNTRFSFASGVPAIHQLMAANGNGKLRVWITEFGYQTCPSTLFPYCVTEAKAATWTEDAILKARTWPYVKSMFIYRLDDQPQFGITGRNLQPTLLYNSVSYAYRLVREQTGHWLSSA